jgi:hypothetical protein
MQALEQGRRTSNLKEIGVEEPSEGEENYDEQALWSDLNVRK